MIYRAVVVKYWYVMDVAIVTCEYIILILKEKLTKKNQKKKKIYKNWLDGEWEGS